ncbi:hypothetical protein C8A03DRAFT_40218 [Achaetomium macrosporum]|uniref:Aminoglycoside phosphotransferase domain-containing protein n=1 Tax=Achaetomium macrosporum TaxID=79813 RepID=A0AAN7HEP2_9PEZI|nr:hypothetical protein C8A03DRAFT_40218 [Achaetomium macrosporum]
MAEIDERDVVPDAVLLEHIFGNNQPSSVSVILQNWDKCVFKASFSTPMENGRHECVVRLEAQDATSASSFAMVAAMQEISSVCIPGLVPETLEFQYSVMEFVEGVALEEAWDNMMDEDRRSVTASVVEALLKLQSVRLSEAKKAALGGPSTGFIEDGRSLLSSVEQEWKLKRPFLTVQPTADPKGLLIKSSFEDIGSTIVTDSDTEYHSKTPGGNTRYKLAAIIDWELAGFCPPSYQLMLQNTYLGGANRHASFHMLLKDGMKDIIPRSPPQMALLRAMEIIFESRQRDLYEGKNIPANIRRKFMELLRLFRDEDPYVGWRCEGTSSPEFSREDLQKLEDEVIEDMVRTRQMKVKAG